ncbi:hypothetical protein HYV91_01270 [Candidatus Wolfebacteria bacterium]|nr:hypothetical protein [Candidatus Wolfebacteria bacterium]
MFPLKLKPPLRLPKKGILDAKAAVLQRRAGQLDREIKQEKAQNRPTQAKEKYKEFMENKLRRLEKANQLKS